ncbi:zinc ribbon domain-containing protein [Candidatus Uabimicrobium sp. HlEnr_7]|uniref:double zinc ribbon domain-containing protein n=1 Tax=Candidatus Uabimicrobium helgolandensis TaxID=3095367 RepID=UPI0035575703
MVEHKICNSCRHQIKREHTFCMHCGVSQNKEINCPTCHSPIAGDTNFCTKCGNKTTAKTKDSNLNLILVMVLTSIVISLALRIPIQRVVFFFVPVVIIWIVHSLLKKIEES